MIVETVIIVAVAVIAAGGFAALATGNTAFLIAGSALGIAIIAALVGSLRIERTNERRMHTTSLTLAGKTLDASWKTLFGREISETLDLSNAEVIEVVRGSGVFTLHFWPATKREGIRKGYIGNVSADRLKRSAPEVVAQILAISPADAPAVRAALEATNLAEYGALAREEAS